MMLNEYGVLLAGVVPVGIFTLTFAVPPAGRFGIAGEKVQGPAVAGKPIHASVTGPLKLLSDVKLKLVLATPAAGTVACSGVLNDRPSGRTTVYVMACC